MGKLRAYAWMVAVASLVAATACSSNDNPEAAPSSSTTAPASSTEARRVIVSGRATLDGRPVDSKWVGAVVLDDGLVTPCQTALPPVVDGRYSVAVFTASASAGCGKAGTKVALWIYAKDRIVFTTNSLPWPDAGSTATFDAEYTAAQPKGATPEVAQFQGGALAANGRELPVRTRVEAFVGDTRCGVASVRASHDFTGYILSVVGPDSIPGCTRGAPIEFRLNGKPATPTNIENTPPGQSEALDLRVA